MSGAFPIHSGSAMIFSSVISSAGGGGGRFLGLHDGGGERGCEDECNTSWLRRR